ncbi:MAG: PIN domain-containing protein [Alphaproteobacteria bacterium]|nr:PIN domain-containing protein [Alphaproteobacteria bacterium]
MPVFDTNIVIDYINGNAKAADELGRCSDRLISIMSWMEILVGCNTIDKEQQVIEWMAAFFDVVYIDDEIAAQAVNIRRDLRLKLPDAVILATAHHHKTVLITRDRKDFPLSVRPSAFLMIFSVISYLTSRRLSVYSTSLSRHYLY